MTTRAKQRKRWAIGRILLPVVLVPIAITTLGAPPAVAVDIACEAREVVITEASRSEGDTTASLRATFQISADGCAAGSLSYRTVPGASGATSATAGVDYVTTTGTLTWQSGDPAVKNVYVEIKGDLAIEGDEAFSLELHSFTGLSADVTSAAGWIRNDDGGYLEIDSEPDCLGQTGDVCEALVLASPPSVKETTLRFGTLAETATEIADFYPVTSQLVTIPPGATAVKIKIMLRADRDFTASRYFSIVISQPSAGTITKAVTRVTLPRA